MLSFQAGTYGVGIEPWTEMFKPPQGVKRLQQQVAQRFLTTE